MLDTEGIPATDQPVTDSIEESDTWDEIPAPRGPNPMIQAVKAVPPVVSRMLPQSDTESVEADEEGGEKAEVEESNPVDEFVNLSREDEEYLLGTGDQEEKMLGDSPLDDAGSPFVLPESKPRKAKYSVGPNRPAKKRRRLGINPFSLGSTR